MREPAQSSDHFPTATTGLQAAQPPTLVELADGAQFDLRIAPVTKRFGDKPMRMLAYNGSIPGPTLRVRQGAQVSVNVVNDGDLDTTVHWHGLRLDNRYDGTTATQPAIPLGGAFTYRLTFPDPGVYWYHPHIREDYGQEMGLYGNIVVEPAAADYWPPVNRELTLTLDDILIEDGGVAAFDRRHPTFTAMGRFGTTLLANGEETLSLRASHGEVVRFYLTNTANTRVFNVGVRGARMKLVGGDSGRYEHEAFVDTVVIAPSERAVVDVLFEGGDTVTLEHRTPNRTYALATIAVDEERREPSFALQYDELRTNADLVVERTGIGSYLTAEPAKTLALVAEMDMGEPTLSPGALIVYVCPMHADVVSDAPGRCPHCGMKLVPAQLVAAAAHGQHQHGHSSAADNHQHGVEHADFPVGIEWEDDMVDVNRMTNPSNMRWKLIDRQTGADGASIDWRFRVGERVKIRIVNEMDSDHPMHHPFHIHGAGRFLILSRDGSVEPNLVWKDTVLVPTGQTVDLLFDVTHPGVWMAHCHIAEHHESGMMLTFHVDR
jgi:FtsP/CotA-like multicopper oxidase with cupredoxin domain